MRQEDLIAFQRDMRALNQALKEKYDAVFQLKKEALKAMITEEIGSFSMLKPLNTTELSTINGVCGVDGSVVKAGGVHPHYIELFQGLALSTRGEEVRRRRIYTPVLSGDDAISAEKLHDRYLAEVELDAAVDMAETKDVSVMIMDGGLLRYRINSPEKWDELKICCLEKDILLVGAIKDIKTREIAERTGKARAFYDRELLAGKLEVGEILQLNDQGTDEEKETKKEAEGLSSAFYRPSEHPEVVGIDVLKEQREHLIFLARLLYTLTPKKSRGVPFFIDIVDAQVKISPEDLQLLLEESVDRDIMERFFVSERDRRV